MIIEENGKVYDLDPATGLVTEASLKEEAVEADTMDATLAVGARVEAEGQTGHIIASTDSVYGTAWAVRFDNGVVAELPEEALKISSAEVAYESPLAALQAEFEAYETMDAVTTGEIRAKAATAQALNVRAKALATDSKLAFSDKVAADHIVVVTGTDILDLKDAQLQAEVAEQGEYLGAFNHYEIGHEVTSGSSRMGLKGDSSWLGEALENWELPETTEADLAARATEVVAHFNREQLSNESFLADAAALQVRYLGMNEEQQGKFASFLKAAAADRISELPAEEKTASTDDNLDDFDTTSLYV